MEIEKDIAEIFGGTDYRITELQGGWMINTYKVSGIKKYNSKPVVFRKYDVSQKDKVEKEANLLKYLQIQNYPVPNVLETNIQNQVIYAIHEFIDGDLLTVSLRNGDISEITTKYATILFDLHNLDIPEFLRESIDPSTFYGNRLNDAKNYLKNLNLDILLPILEWLEDRMKTIEFDNYSIIHRDLHPNNIIIQDKELIVIDWFDAQAADPREELGWLSDVCYAWNQEEFYQQIIKNYENLGGNTVDIDFFEVINLVRRFIDVLLVVKEDSKNFIVKEDSLNMIKRNKDSELRFYQRLVELTGIEIKEYKDLFIN